VSSAKALSPTSEERLTLAFATKDAWAAWLDEHHAAFDGIVMRLSKKASGLSSITQAEAVEIALCYGWVDGKGKRESDTSWLLTLTPRRPRSIWSKRNREKALALIAAGAMKPAGLAEVQRAQQDGRWEAAYDSPTTMTVPEDLEAALNGQAPARAFFETLDGRNRYAILFRLQTTRRAETRRKRVEQFVEMLARKEKLYP